MKIKLVILDKRNISFQKAKYDRETRLASIYGRKFFRKSIITKYAIDPDHIYYNPKGMAYAIVDVGSRQSVNPDSETVSVSLHSESQIDEPMKNMLDYLTESTFWHALLKRVKIPLIQIIIFMLAGAGIYSFVRMVLSAFGFQIP
jgi:hypothetical protein